MILRREKRKKREKKKKERKKKRNVTGQAKQIENNTSFIDEDIIRIRILRAGDPHKGTEFIFRGNNDGMFVPNGFRRAFFVVASPNHFRATN